MGISLKELMNKLEGELQSGLFRDYCPNGLQVEGKQEINRIVTGVTACQALIDKAIELKADAVFVHHGYFWKGEDATITGMKRRRVEALLKHNINLIAYHLPLDGHPTMGNNAQLAKLMNWSTEGGMDATTRPVGSWGKLGKVQTVAELSQQLEQQLGREPLVIEGGTHDIETIAWCTGGAQKMIEEALALGVDAYVSGEISESTVHFARENGIHYFSAGHHATERYGVQAVGAWLEQECGVEHIFIDIASPV
ncbi:metal-binding protein [Endozoicomonas montiporae]|uniref:GTP cyclohydrolase 1 type 2 homolog n=2 Tax=Endozoicomonas montiporae TaxID=1027273 RepID=A0A081N2T7_9GAMM|nr:Nif3-like dinuclear metal center hexameric protein [Endozoicomonas montiporae]AMO58028.1 Nif3-like dinuclear metal center hexameric protein [Endozoicomonas montiporae CL-33]KEQ12760.1 metal-binding protein [Endozoicomonas montiporae]